jgi:hypothetical protein
MSGINNQQRNKLKEVLTQRAQGTQRENAKNEFYPEYKN